MKRGSGAGTAGSDARSLALPDPRRGSPGLDLPHGARIELPDPCPRIAGFHAGK